MGTNNVIYDSQRRRHPAIDELSESFRYKYLILQLVRRDILTRYKRSVLGVAWTLLNPLGMMLILTIAFSQVFKFDVEGYPTYVLSGLLPWTFFSQTTTAAMVNLIWGGDILNRIYIPRASFAIAALGTGLVNILLSTVPLLLVMLLTGIPITPAIVFLPIPILLLACFSLGIGLLISTLAVYFPDIAEMYQIIIMGWFYLTPIIYPESILPEAIRTIALYLNPMYYLVTLYRMPVYYGQLPSYELLTIAIIISVAALFIGWWVFSIKSDEFAYKI
jgi:ABC-type polysaccharide/polyol phosphate export permease